MTTKRDVYTCSTDLVDFVSDGEVVLSVLNEPASSLLHERNDNCAHVIVVIIVHIAHYYMVLRVRVEGLCKIFKTD